MQGDNRAGYNLDEQMQRPHRPQRGEQRHDTDAVFIRSRPTKVRHRPHERQYESDPEGRYGRNLYRGRLPSDDILDRRESHDRRMGDEGGEGGEVADGA